MTNEFIVEGGGFAFEVPHSHYFKFELLEGQQILDVAIWTKDNPKHEFLSMHHHLEVFIIIKMVEMYLMYGMQH